MLVFKSKSEANAFAKAANQKNGLPMAGLPANGSGFVGVTSQVWDVTDSKIRGSNIEHSAFINVVSALTGVIPSIETDPETTPTIDEQAPPVPV